jgi:hypothetical protein
MTQPVPRRLPVGRAIQRSYLYAWECRRVFFGPAAIFAAVTILAELLLLAVAGHSSKAAEYSLMTVEELLALAFAVGISRFVLIGETHPGFAFFRFDRNLVQYLRMALLMFILVILGAIPGLMVAGAPSGSADAGTQTVAALVATAITIMTAATICRLILALPAAALGEQTPMKVIWQATQGNGARIFAAILLTIAPFMVLEGIIAQFVPIQPEGAAQPIPVSLAEVIITIVIGLISPVQTIVCTILLSLCYDALVRGGGPPAE